MPDDKKKRGKPDRTRINLSQEHELRYWSQALGVPQYVLFLIDDIRGLLEEMYNPQEYAPTVEFYRRRLSLAKGAVKASRGHFLKPPPLPRSARKGRRKP